MSAIQTPRSIEILEKELSRFQDNEARALAELREALPQYDKENFTLSLMVGLASASIKNHREYRKLYVEYADKLDRVESLANEGSGQHTLASARNFHFYILNVLNEGKQQP
jgi:hypothetical protein